MRCFTCRYICFLDYELNLNAWLSWFLSKNCNWSGYVAKDKGKEEMRKNVLKHDYIFDAALTVKQIKI